MHVLLVYVCDYAKAVVYSIETVYNVSVHRTSLLIVIYKKLLFVT